ncbi:MAG: recombination mediator RecR [Thermodesulfobacteriota bacterium]
MQKLPQALQDLVQQLAELPGVGPKSALRMALTLLQWPQDKVRTLGRSIEGLRDALTLCSECGGISDADPCMLCSDPGRRQDVLCLVADWDALLAIEQAGFFQGRYLILGGLLSPLDGVQASQLDVRRLRQKLATGQVQELVLALGSTRDAEATESYISSLVHREFPAVEITRLAQGIPVGSDLRYVDQETLKQSLQHRQRLC